MLFIVCPQDLAASKRGRTLGGASSSRRLDAADRSRSGVGEVYPAGLVWDLDHLLSENCRGCWSGHMGSPIMLGGLAGIRTRV